MSRGRILFLNGLSLQAGEVSNGDVSDKRVHLALGIFVFVAATAQADADAVGDGADTLGPDSLVQARVNADVLSAHGLDSKGLDGLDGAGGTLLEGLAVDALVQVDGVLTGYHFGNVGHFCKTQKNK